MIDDIFKVFGEQTGEILFEIIKDCMDDYLYIFDLQNNTFEISQSAVERFNMSKNVLTDAANEVMKVVYEEDREMLTKHLCSPQRSAAALPSPRWPLPGQRCRGS